MFTRPFGANQHLIRPIDPNTSNPLSLQLLLSVVRSTTFEERNDLRDTRISGPPEGLMHISLFSSKAEANLEQGEKIPYYFIGGYSV